MLNNLALLAPDLFRPALPSRYLAPVEACPRYITRPPSCRTGPGGPRSGCSNTAMLALFRGIASYPHQYVLCIFLPVHRLVKPTRQSHLLHARVRANIYTSPRLLPKWGIHTNIIGLRFHGLRETINFPCLSGSSRSGRHLPILLSPSPLLSVSNDGWWWINLLVVPIIEEVD